jgi:hypothetical protein
VDELAQNLVQWRILVLAALKLRVLPPASYSVSQPVSLT